MAISFNLSNFRSHISSSFCFESGINFICAPNGSGKTNLLEAVSLFSPGRGLRKANSADMVSTSANFFSISLEIAHNLININYSAGQKQISWNGGKISALELIDMIGIFWLTPQIIFNFWKEPKVRRDFFDRIVGNFIPNHMYHCAKYENIRSYRSKLIKEQYANNAAYNSIEKILIDEGLEIVKNRKEIVEKLNSEMDYRISTIGSAEGVSVHDLRSTWMEQLKKSRIENRDSFGPHKTNIVIEKDKLTSLQASTGQQHMMIIHFILTAFKLLKQEFKILLLDDILSHLDPENRSAVMNLVDSHACDSYILIADTSLPKLDFEVNQIAL